MASFRPSEKELDRALADALSTSQPFLQWFLGCTKFASRNAKIVSCRSDHPWGTHPYVLDCGEAEGVETTRQSETDILLIVKAADEETLGIHVENKVGVGRFTADQPEMYAFRARHWIGNPRYGNYTDFDTVLIAPRGFIERNHDQVLCFGAVLAHEDIAQYVPAFAPGPEKG